MNIYVKHNTFVTKFNNKPLEHSALTQNISSSTVSNARLGQDAEFGKGEGVRQRV